MYTLVVGGSGLVGSALRNLCGHDSSFIWPRRNELDVSTRLIQHQLPKDVSKIIYLAQGRNYRDFPSSASETFGVNVSGPLALLSHYAGRGLEHFTYASSGNVALELDRRTRTHHMTSDFYTATKLAAEELLTPWRDLVPLGIIRLYTIYGDAAAASSLISRIGRSITIGEQVFLNGQDGDTFQPTAAKDVARALSHVSQVRWSGTANYGGPEHLTVRQISLRLAEQSARAPDFAHTGNPAMNYASTDPSLDTFLPQVRATCSFPAV